MSEREGRRARLKPKIVSMDHWMVVENLRHRLRKTSGIERETKEAMSWAEAEMMLQLADAFRRTQPIWLEHFNRNSGALPSPPIKPEQQE